MVLDPNAEDIVKWRGDRNRDEGCCHQHRIVAPPRLTIQRVTPRRDVSGSANDLKLLWCLGEDFDNFDCPIEDFADGSAPSEISAIDL